MRDDKQKPQSSGPFYRFRSVDALLGDRRELDNQEIYFCPLHDLNDPMEGYMDLFWRGDKVVWRNLLRHYLECLTQSFMAASILGEEFDVARIRGFMLMIPATRTVQMSEIHAHVRSAFFATHNVAKIPEVLGSRTTAIRREELELCLRGIHGVALKSIITALRERGRFPPENKTDSGSVTLEADALDRLLKAFNGLEEYQIKSGSENLTALLRACAHVQSQVDLILYRGSTDGLSRAWHAIFRSFPEHYVDSIRDLVYPEWYVACFVSDPTNTAMWGHYGDGHKGVCLQFRAKEEGGSPFLKMRGIRGWHGGPNGGGPSYGDIPLSFEQVNYTGKLPEIDFFRSLGRISEPDLRSQWYRDEQGNESECVQDVFGSMPDWRTRYWAQFKNITLTKLQDWRHEDEYRLILTSALDSFKTTENRKLKYQFCDLDGIIFGIRTSLADKARIIDIVNAKCKAEGRTAFAFHQAVYAAHSGKIEICPLSMIQP